jgi:hypothetical protein
LEVVENLAERPHPLGSPENDRVREELLRRLETLGFETRVQAVAVVFDHPLREETSVRAAWPRNVLARRPGSTDSPAIALMTHYDSVPSGPGAGDAASGVATLLETARALAASEESLARDLLLVITDGEEVGLMGAQGFLQEDPWAERIGLLLNFEARGASGPPFMFQTGPGNAALVSRFATVAPYPTASSTSIEVYRRMPNDTDATIVEAAGLPYLNFAFVDDYFRYHAGSDTPENLSLRSLQHEGENTLALVRHLASLETLLTSPGDATYFNLSPFVLLRYPEEVTMAVGIGALLVGLWALVVGWRGGRFRLPGLATGVVWSAAGWLGTFWGIGGIYRLAGDPARPFALFYRYHLLVAAFFLLTLGFLAGLWNERQRARRVSAATAALLVLAALALAPEIGLAAVAAVLLLALCVARPAWFRGDGVAAAHLVVWLVLLGLTLAQAPHASFLFAWPLLLGGAVLGRTWRTHPESRVGHALAFAPAVMLWASILYTIYLALGVENPGMAMAVLALVLGLGAAWLHRSVGARTALALAVAGAAIVAFVAWSDPYGPATPRPAEVLYALDADAGEAFWATRDTATIPWTEELLGEEPGELAADRFFPESEETWRGTPAPVLLDAETPVGPVEQSVGEEGWIVAFRVRSRPGAERIRLLLPAAAYASGDLDGRPVPLPEASEDPWRWDLWGLPEDGVAIRVTGTGDPPASVHWTLVDYSAGGPVGKAIPPRPSDVMPRVWGLSEAAVVAGTTELRAGG